MIELMIAGIVMVVGFLGMMILITVAIGTNNRNKLDTNATLAAQLVLEEVKSDYANGTAVPLTDCAGNTWTIGSSAGGATVSGAMIDWSATPVSNYNMNYTVCTANGTQSTYEVRWNVQTVTSHVVLVTVGSRPKGASSDLKLFALPVTLRGYAGQ